MSVTCHYVDGYKLKSHLLDCFPFTDQHTAQNLAQELVRVASEWGISDKIVACVSDNATNIKAAIRITGWANLPCFAHTLNLVVTESLKAIYTTVTKMKAVVEYTHRSSTASEKLKATQQQRGFKVLRLKQDVVTRWNSTYHMLERFVEMKDAIITTLALVNPTLNTFSPNEWEIMQEACQSLKPFYEVTVEVSAEK